MKIWALPIKDPTADATADRPDLSRPLLFSLFLPLKSEMSVKEGKGTAERQIPPRCTRIKSPADIVTRHEHIMYAEGRGEKMPRKKMLDLVA